MRWRSPSLQDSKSQFTLPQDKPISEADPIDRLAALLVAAGHLDAKTLERARRVGAESGQRLDAVLIQLGLSTERTIAQTYAALLGLPITAPSRYPADEPVLPGRLNRRFLRQARALPVALDGERLVLAVADPLDAFTPAAVSAASGRPVMLEIAIPVELDAALARLYPEAGGDGEEAPPMAPVRSRSRTTPSGCATSPARRR